MIDCDMSKIFIPAIDDNGALYKIEKLEAHRLGVPHLALSVFIYDGDALLLQKRAGGKYHCGGQWANSCCTHPHWGEAIEVAAYRRLKEELGIEISLTKGETFKYKAEVGNGLIENECVTFFKAECKKEKLVYALNPEEVSDIRWLPLKALKEEMSEAPQNFTPWLHIYMNEVMNKS